jgi:predicted DNA-binding transcriptional regulator YafY
VKPVLVRKAQPDRNVQLIRTLSIIRDLDRAGGMDLYELAERYGTNVRTIRRDLEGLQAAGLPLAEEPGDGRKKRWRLAYKDKLAKLAELVDVTHYLALRVAMDGAPGRKSSLFTSLEDLVDKIEDHLGAREKRQLEEILGAFHSYEKHAYLRTAPDVFWPLIAAVAQKRLCQVLYRAARPGAVDKQIRLLPLRMFVYQQGVYLHAFVPKHAEVITLNLQRLVDLKVLEQTGEPPRGYDPEKLERSAFGVFAGKQQVTYKLRFSAEIAPYIRERSWHPSQRVRELGEGRLELTFTCGESYEVTAWVASWRHHVEVLAPKALRAELRRYADWLATTYTDER